MTNNNSDNTVYILDSYGLIFRCYFAFISRPLTNSRGENVSALFGFFRNMHWILQHYKPNYIFAAMDSKTKTFRHEAFPEYKANRNKTPEDLHAQIPWIEEVLQALGIPVLQCDGYEADDIIATVAHQCEEQGRPCRILSGDKDLMQLVTENTKILKPESGASTWKLTGIEGVRAEWGVEPAQLLDLLSLYGDSADNIPGVHGVGIKTASKLLNDYKDLDGIYANIDQIKGAMQKKLIEGKDSAYMSRDLVRLCNTVPCSNINDSISAKPYTLNYDAAAEILNKYEVFNVAKSYVQLSLELNAVATMKAHVKANNLIETKEGEMNVNVHSLPLAQASKESLATPSNGAQVTPEWPRNAPQETLEPAVEIIQNITTNYKAITKVEELEEYISTFLSSINSDDPKSSIIAYDCETDGLNVFTPHCLVGFSLCYKPGYAIYVPIQDGIDDLFNIKEYMLLKDALTQLMRLFTNPKVTVVMHNAKFDIKVLVNNFKLDSELVKEYKNKTLISAKIADTMIAAWILNPERIGKSGYSLEYMAETQLGLKGIEFSEIVPKGQTFKNVPLETAYKYAAEDADFTLKLYLHYLNKGVAEMCSAEGVADSGQTSVCTDEAQGKRVSPPLNLFDFEMQILPILVQMELTGIHLDTATLHAYNKELSIGIEEAEKAIYKEVGHEFNIASPKQLQTVLFEERGLKPGKKTKTGYSTDTSVLEELAHVDIIPKMILEYREMTKLQSTYVETLPTMADIDGRIHTDFVQTGTATGRLSCREPNLQNIPVRSEAGRRIRSAFTAPEGKVLISADYAQIELVILAHLSGDVNMCKAFNEGTDVHKATAALIYGVSPEAVTPDMRRTAKTINFGVIYGMSAFRLAQDLEISRTQAAGFIEDYFHQYAQINNFIQSTIQNAEANGYVETIFGRRRPILAINSRNKVEKAAAERIAVNTPVQGSAADIVKQAMLNVTKALKAANSSAKLLLQVHDELIFECPDNPQIIEETIALIKDKMENAVKLNVPLRVSVEYGKSWGEFH